MHTNSGVILSRNIVPAYQIRSLIERDARTADIVLSELDAYTCLDQHSRRFLICDIDDAEIQGMVVAQWFSRRFHGAPWYAICRHGNSRNMRLAREHGADGYFFLNSAGLALDPHTGLARELLRRTRPPMKAAMPPMPRAFQPQAGY